MNVFVIALVNPSQMVPLIMLKLVYLNWNCLYEHEGLKNAKGQHQHYLCAAFEMRMFFKYMSYI